MWDIKAAAEPVTTAEFTARQMQGGVVLEYYYHPDNLEGVQHRPRLQIFSDRTVLTEYPAFMRSAGTYRATLPESAYTELLQLLDTLVSTVAAGAAYSQQRGDSRADSDALSYRSHSMRSEVRVMPEIAGSGPFSATLVETTSLLLPAPSSSREGPQAPAYEAAQAQQAATALSELLDNIARVVPSPLPDGQ